ncbi:MAG: YkgJ family cysteine cluster protein [Candidatus Methanoperedens sp.]|nr:YkgJ family cysteine cluster protein [Candidatus Methanoperedens sp.]
MDIISLRRRIDRLVHTPSSSLIPEIEKSGFACACCGWCCCRNFNIRITENILRPSNAISIFPSDIRRIIKMTGCKWDEVAEPDIYSCVLEKENVVVGWILKRRKDNGNSCVFYRNGLCTIYSCRPLICRCYPFFMGESGIEIMYCNNLKEITVHENALKISRALKHYEIEKLRSYIRIIKQIGDKLKLNIDSMKSLPDNFSGNVIVFDGENITKCRISIF